MTSYRIRNIAIAAGLAVVAAILVLLYVSSRDNKKESPQAAAGSATVYVASRDIPAGVSGAEVATGYLKAVQVPEGRVVPGAISKPAELSDLSVVDPIFSGEQVTLRHFKALAAQGVLADISELQRAVSIAGDPDQLLAGKVTDGDRVDIIANVKYKVTTSDGRGGTTERDRVATRIVLREILVLRAAADPGSRANQFTQRSFAALLALTDNQAQKLFFVMKNDEWSFALRPVDAKDSPDSVETIESILGDGLKAEQLLQVVQGRRFGDGVVSGTR